MTSNLLISGGPLHDFAASSGALVEVFTEASVESTVFDDPRAALAELAAEPEAWDFVTVNALRWEMASQRHAAHRDAWAFTLREDEAHTLDRHVRSGGALLACHTATICFDSHPLWAGLIGATWNWERSSHPPQSLARVTPTAAGRKHAITSGIQEFVTNDEIYGFLDYAPGLVPLLTSRHGGTDHPVLWARSVGKGRVVTDLLGHDAQAMRQPEHREILARAARWMCDQQSPSVECNDTERSSTSP